ncbi:hypothetical protein [Lysobacter enzymogenes]|uniref:hypothetical protein n=1 Tax=Lysobacter enzymogenes TaxID=69 RepID=UPI001AFC7573|nr:hypothetical protein [Lysobacter enzymogenes]QQQ03663.1 hypothetical protein JHW41_12305 [Lysobacter enzymogenes]
MDLSNPNIDLTGDWVGWRQCGRWLISDDGQRITIGRLRGLLWREQMELYRQGFASRRQAEQAKSRRPFRSKSSWSTSPTIAATARPQP